MAENKINVPSGMGGLMRYDAEYKSKFMFPPSAVIVFIIIVLLFVIALKILFPLSLS